jgi:hypothetical protein
MVRKVVSVNTFCEFFYQSAAIAIARGVQPAPRLRL